MKISLGGFLHDGSVTIRKDGHSIVAVFSVLVL